MSFPRQRSGRSERSRLERRLLCEPEVLESRQLLQAGIPNYLSPWIPTDLLVTNPITNERELYRGPRTGQPEQLPTAAASATKARSSPAPTGRATSGSSRFTGRAK